MTWEQLWEKYETQIRAADPTLEGEALKTSVCLRILEKSCCTSEIFNNMAGCSDLNTFLPDTIKKPAATAADTDIGCPPAGEDDHRDMLLPSSQPVAARDEIGQEVSDDVGRRALARAYVAECAAICAGALRLDRLVKPFRATAKGEGEGEGLEGKRKRRRVRRPLGRPRCARRSAPSRATV